MRTTVLPTTLATVMALASGCGENTPVDEAIRPVQTMRIADLNQFSGRSFPGRAEATLAVDMAFEVQGRLIERPVRVGDRVTQGEVLARLDSRDYQNDADSAQARLDRAQAFLDRIREAVKVGGVAEQDLTDAQAQYDVAIANLNIAEKALADTAMSAPFDGSVSATYVENFQNVQRKQQVLRLLDVSRIEMQIDVPEHLISLVPYVTEITVEFEAFRGRPVSAEIEDIGTEASTTTRTFPVTLVMDQPDDFTILPGMSGRVRGRPTLPDDFIEQGVEIPGGSILEEDDRAYVWVVEEANSTVKRVAVHLAGLSALGVRVEGLESGQLIITAGAHYLREGQRVRVPDLTATPGDAS